MAFMDDGRADTLLRLRMMPKARGGDVTITACFHCHTHTAKATHTHHDAFTVDGRGVNERIQSAACPQLLAGLRLVSADALGPGHDEFIATVHVAQNRIAPRTDPDIHVLLAGLGIACTAARFIVLPHGLARALLHRDEKRFLSWPHIEIAKITSDYRRGRVTPDVHLLAEIALPQLFAVQVVAIHSG